MSWQPLLLLLLPVLLAIALPVLVAVPPPASRFDRLVWRLARYLAVYARHQSSALPNSGTGPGVQTPGDRTLLRPGFIARTAPGIQFTEKDRHHEDPKASGNSTRRLKSTQS